MMNPFLLFGPGFVGGTVLIFQLFSGHANGQEALSETVWQDLAELTVRGKGWQEPDRSFARLPVEAESMVRPSVWRLSSDSAGLYVEFVSDAPSFSLQWEVTREALALWHMPSVSVSGFDLYVRNVNGWDWLAVARPRAFPTSESVLVQGLVAEERHYRLYFPLYNGIVSARVGIPRGFVLEDRSGEPEPSIVFYGTSIVQGACASRSGMAYPSLLGRRLGIEAVNLGFSGNGRAEPEVANLLAQLSPVVFVLDPLPNMEVATVSERMENIVRVLRAARPRTPIVLVENIVYPASAYIASIRNVSEERNRHLRSVFYRLIEEGVPKVYLVPADRLLGGDGLDTVDGIHPTDLGFIRMADGLEPLLRSLLEAN